MIGTTTLTIADGETGARVFYLMTREAARDLNALPKDGAFPDVTIPVDRKEILRLLKADSGFEYPAGQIQIRPTGISSSLLGGVSVEAGGISSSGAYRELTLTNLSFVLDSHGTLVTYQH